SLSSNPWLEGGSTSLRISLARRTAGGGCATRFLLSPLNQASFLNLQILVNQCSCEFAGMNFQGQGAFVTDAADEVFAALDNLLSGHGFVHFTSIIRISGGQLRQVSLRNNCEQQKMLGKNLRGAFYHFRGHGAIGKIGDPDDKRALLLYLQQ